MQKRGSKYQVQQWMHVDELSCLCKYVPFCFSRQNIFLSRFLSVAAFVQIEAESRSNLYVYIYIYTIYTLIFKNKTNIKQNYTYRTASILTQEKSKLLTYIRVFFQRQMHHAGPGAINHCHCTYIYHMGGLGAEVGKHAASVLYI